MYTVFRIPKNNGGFRIIEAPEEPLKKKQKEILKELYRYFNVSPFCHGFTPYRSIVTMAKGHVGKKYVGCIDIKDFFPSIKQELFKDIFVSLPMREENKEKRKAILDEILEYCFYDFGDGRGKRLPQGAPTSPYLSNLYLYHFDWAMAWVAYRLGLDYSRYADDITVSSCKKKEDIHVFFKISETKLKEFKLNLNKKKKRVMPYWRRQLVCGLVVNDKINLKREWRKNLRAEIHQGGKGNSSLGKLAFLNMIQNPGETYTSREILDSISLIRKLTKEVHNAY